MNFLYKYYVFIKIPLRTVVLRGMVLVGNWLPLMRLMLKFLTV